ncbi:MAG: transposase, partial [Acidobacteriales bacterium]
TPDNCVSFEGMTLQIPPDKYRCHYVRAKVNVHLYMDGSRAIFHGPRKLADYEQNGKLKKTKKDKAA